MAERKFSVRLFPDSGHHYYFVPFAIDLNDRDKAKQYLEKTPLPTASQELTKLCTGNPDWMPARKNNTTSLAWLRGKFGTRYEGPPGAGFTVYGLWISIETNTGARQEGYLYEVVTWATEDDPKSMAARNEPQTSPYVAIKPTDIDFETPAAISLNEAFELKAKVGLSSDTIVLDVHWQREGGDSVPVHLVVDFGNTRTIAFGVELPEDRMANGGLRDICRPIFFRTGHDDAATTARGRPNPSELVPDSWIILREPPFAGPLFVPPQFVSYTYLTAGRLEGAFSRLLSIFRKRKPDVARGLVRRVPYMFIEFSPVVMGPEATSILAKVDVTGGHLSFLSSPKRYGWDDDPVGPSHWFMHPRIGSDRTRPLRGQMFRFLPRQPERRQWIVDTDNPAAPPEWEDPTIRPTEDPIPDFSRADSLIWTALSIIERASRQIQSESWRSNHPARRYLEKVVVTFPPGWTNEEFRAYWMAWYLATEIYNWTRGPGLGRQPGAVLDLGLPIDEAVASQLAIVFSEIHHLGDRARVWTELYGRMRGTQRTVRVLTIDIGGGTLDTAAVEYHCDPTKAYVQLGPEILFSDSSTTAGDKLVKDIIEYVLLPKLGERFASDDRKSLFEEAAKASPWARDEEDRLRRMVVTRAVFVPMVFKWLEEVSNGRKGTFSLTPQECGAYPEQIDKLNEIFRVAGLIDSGTNLLGPTQPFDVESDRINKVILDWCGSIADVHSRYVAAFDCDLVIVTGKPSELPQVRDVLEKRLPIDPNRIVFAKDYYAGSWFPVTAGGKIPDAKMVTVIGAALYQAIGKNRIPHWQIKEVDSRHIPARNCWGVVRSVTSRFDPEDVILAADVDEGSKELPSYCVIGRTRFPQNDPEPVYVLRWRDPAKRASRGTASIHVLLRRVRVDVDGAPLRTEHLRLADVYGTDEFGEAITLDDIELHLRTLPLDEEHWLDRGRFTVRWR